MYVSMIRAVLAALVLLLGGGFAGAQTVVQLPVFVTNTQGSVKDLGNGPTEIRILQGSAQLWTMQSSGTGQTINGLSSTTVALISTPTVVPCVGCIISGTGITTGTTVSALGANGTSLTLSAAMTIATATTLSWGAACPSSVSGANPVMLVQAGVGADLPLYTESRVCGAGQYAAGATLLQFPIGAH